MGREIVSAFKILCQHTGNTHSDCQSQTPYGKYHFAHPVASVSDIQLRAHRTSGCGRIGHPVTKPYPEVYKTPPLSRIYNSARNIRPFTIGLAGSLRQAAGKLAAM
ncbi:MAG: hypothetical protein LBL04_05130 [Bacteroidales bacterium]|jgi:hypothetical protein|nr:hypothetical protein [Bacteroidales bacterium]